MTFLRWLLCLIRRLFGWLCPSPADLEIIIPTKRRPEMSKKVKMTLSPKGKPTAVMPAVLLSDIVAEGGSLLLQLVDATGAPFVISDPTTVTTTMLASDPTVTITAGADALHYVITVQPPLASSQSTITISATLAYVAGTPGPFTASLPVTCDLPTPPPQPVDLQIILG